MEAKEGFLILLNLAILGTVIAAAVYIFQIGNGNRSVKCPSTASSSATCKKIDISLDPNSSQCGKLNYNPNESLILQGCADLDLSQANACTNLEYDPGNKLSLL